MLPTENSSDFSTFRVLDASINRAGEGLRVVEDFVRMQLSDRFLASQIKQMRHDLTQAVQPIDESQRVAARDSMGDVGRTIETASEYDRGADNDVEATRTALVRANLSRVQQAFRTIEEFSKSIDTRVAKTIEQLRYQVYTLEKAILSTLISSRNLAEAKLCVLIDAGESESSLRHLVTQLVDANVGLVQLRDKNRSDRELVAAGRIVAELTRDSQTKFIVNDRADLAVACRADGVHLGQDDLSVADARRIVGATRLIGVSTHSIEQAHQAVLEGASYIGVGPVFPSTTKSFETFVGLELVCQVAKAIALPAFAIGGIHSGNVGQVVESGLLRVAVSSAIGNAENPRQAALEILRQLA